MSSSLLYDLHTHTTASDGRMTPVELVRSARKAGVAALAVTDHDTVAGLDEAEEEARRSGVELIPGIEVSATAHATSVHILGLFIRPREAWLGEFFDTAARERLERIHRIVDKLASLGVHVEASEVFAKSTHGTVGRPHVALVLVERGIVSSYSEAFDRYLGQSAPAYVSFEKLTTKEAIALVRRAGGVSSLAHPGLLGRDELLPEMVDEGLQAIEVYHGEHSPGLAERYLDFARTHGLLVTGGSDFHAIDGAGRGTLGCPELGRDAVERLRRAAAP